MADYEEYSGRRTPELKYLYEQALIGKGPFKNLELFAKTERLTKLILSSITFGHASVAIALRDSLLARHRLFFEAGRSLGHYPKRAIAALKREHAFILKEVDQEAGVIKYNSRADVVKFKKEQIVPNHVVPSASATVSGKRGESSDVLKKAKQEVLEEHFISYGDNSIQHRYWDEEIKFADVSDARVLISEQKRQPGLEDEFLKEAAVDGD